ncbi:hypothetical protein ACSSS7_006279 [Eimeria intestinalis]
MAQTSYPSPYPAYTETYMTPEGYSQAMGNTGSMAYYAGGPDPLQSFTAGGTQQIYHCEDVEVHRMDNMPAYNHVPTTSPPLYQPAAGHMGYGYQDPSMQTFCHSFGGDFSFYNTAANSGMPQGFHMAMQGFPEAVAARKAVKKEIPVAPAVEEAPEPAAKKPQQRKRLIACC